MLLVSVDNLAGSYQIKWIRHCKNRCSRFENWWGTQRRASIVIGIHPSGLLSALRLQFVQNFVKRRSFNCRLWDPRMNMDCNIVRKSFWKCTNFIWKPKRRRRLSLILYIAYGILHPVYILFCIMHPVYILHYCLFKSPNMHGKPDRALPIILVFVLVYLYMNMC